MRAAQRVLAIVLGLGLGCAERGAPAGEQLRGAIVEGPEYPVGVVLSSPASGVQTDPRIAFGAGEFLMVWRDLRSLRSEIYGARLSTAGALLDQTGLPLVVGPSVKTAPAVASDGTEFLVVWHDERAGTPDIYGLRVSASGTPLGSGAFPIASGPGKQTNPSVAFAAGRYLVAWADDRGGAGYHVYAGRLLQGGTLVDGAGLRLSNVEVGAQPIAPSVAATAGLFMVSWPSPSLGAADLYAARVDPLSGMLDAVPLPIATGSADQNKPCSASDGARFLVAWEENGPSGDYDIKAALFGSDGGAVAPAVTIVSNNDAQHVPSCGFDVARGEYIVGWREAVTGVNVARVTTAGAVLDNGGLPLVAGQLALSPALASGGGTLLAAWADSPGLSSGLAQDIYASRLASPPVPLDVPSVLVTRSANGQLTPALAFDGADFLATWLDLRLRNGVIMAARFRPDAGVLGTDGVPLSDGGVVEFPQVAFGTSTYLVVWELGAAFANDIYAMRVSRAGVPLDAAPLLLSDTISDSQQPAVGWSGSSFFVVWQFRTTVFGGSPDIVGARVLENGMLLDAVPIAIAAATGTQSLPAIACEPGQCLVAWQDTRDGGFDIYGARVQASGAVTDQVPILISGAPGTQQETAVAFAGTRYVVAWEDLRGGASPAVYAAQVLSNGTVVAPGSFPVSSAPGPQRQPRIAWDGTTAWVAWLDGRLPSGNDVFAARVATDGGQLDPEGLALTRTDDPEVGLGFSAGNSMLLWAAPRMDYAPAYAAPRLRLAAVTSASGPLGSPCSIDADCAAGMCGGGFCCTTRCDGGSCAGGTCVIAPPADAGMSDGGATTPDGGTTTPDGGATTSDGGVSTGDGGTPEARNFAAGCSCGAAPAGLVLAAATLCVRRRRRPATVR